MPLYEFRCPTCGLFQEWRHMSAYQQPAWCPRCQATARRVFTPPNLVRTPAAIRRMRDLEEKSAHEPEVVVRPAPSQEQDAPSRPRPVVSPHPWAVGHGH